MISPAKVVPNSFYEFLQHLKNPLVLAGSMINYAKHNPLKAALSVGLIAISSSLQIFSLMPLSSYFAMTILCSSAALLIGYDVASNFSITNYMPIKIILAAAMGFGGFALGGALSILPIIAPICGFVMLGVSAAYVFKDIIRFNKADEKNETTQTDLDIKIIQPIEKGIYANIIAPLDNAAEPYYNRFVPAIKSSYNFVKSFVVKQEKKVVDAVGEQVPSILSHIVSQAAPYLGTTDEGVSSALPTTKLGQDLSKGI